MAYTIQISEEQRTLIEQALKILADDPILGPAKELDQKELRILHKMVKELPEGEAETPGALHGLCI